MGPEEFLFLPILLHHYSYSDELHFFRVVITLPRFQLNKSQENVLNSDVSSPDSSDPGDSGHREALPAVLLH